MMSHSFGRGSAIFEVISLHKTQRGPAIFRLQDHVERLFRSAELLEMELAIGRAEMAEAIKATVRENGIDRGFIKVICYYSQVAFAIVPPESPLDVSIYAVDLAQDLGGLDFPFERGTTACISKWRKLDPQTVPVEAKASANYLNGMVARLEAKKRGFENVIMLDTQGFLAEGGTESVFFVEKGRLLTPSLGTVLGSITRRSILDLVEHLGMTPYEGRLSPDLVYRADEAFFSGTPMKTLAMRRIEDRTFDTVPGPMTRRFMDLWTRILSGREERFGDWLSAVSD
jgi:branched-chain amino acid aminotransferase